MPNETSEHDIGLRKNGATYVYLAIDGEIHFGGSILQF
jgi:hypothetical protein